MVVNLTLFLWPVRVLFVSDVRESSSKCGLSEVTRGKTISGHTITRAYPIKPHLSGYHTAGLSSIYP